jgi:transmembrane sensor
MTQFFRKLKSLFPFRERGQTDDQKTDQILQIDFLRLRDVNPDTDRQWQRLHRVVVQGAVESTPSKSRSVPRLALAGAFIVLAMVGGYLYFTSLQHSTSTFATGRGERKEVQLKDGSHVTLSYATQLVVPQLRRGEPRGLWMSGEAYFVVQHNETPFIVSTPSAEVRVLGTEFNLRAREGTVEVGVIHGIVSVGARTDGKDSTLVLSEHQMAFCAPNDFPRLIGNTPSPEYPGWVHGKLFLNKTSFQAACREIEMRFDVTIRVSRDFHQEMLSGILQAETPESALRALCDLDGKKFTHEGSTFSVY